MTDDLLEKDTKIPEKTQKKSAEKFFFHKNVFDEPDIDEDAPPPPPTFTEQELEDAKQKAFAQGKQEGTTETSEAANQSRAALVSRVLDKISRDTVTLFANEEQRSARFEYEAVSLALKMFEKLFPLYYARHGFDELKAGLQAIVEKQADKQNIIVHVSPSNKDGIDAFLSELTAQGLNGTFIVKADENLDEGACRLQWENGGAIQNPQAFAKEIEDLMQQILAGEDTNSHDEDIVADAPDSDAEQLKTADTDDTMDENSGENLDE